MLDIVKENYSAIFEEKLLEEIAQVARIYDFKEGDVLIDFGDYIKNCLLYTSRCV